MLFRVHVVVVPAVPSPFVALLNIPPEENDSEEVLYYCFGVNAPDAASAAEVATSAARHAVDRDGRYVGGAVVEVHVRCAGRDEFRGYEPYLLQPVSRPGIFYVTGITTTFLPKAMLPGVDEALAAARESIRGGVPAPSFRHPMPPDPPAPKRVRLLCPVCGRWAEADSQGIMFSLFEGLDRMSEEFRMGREGARGLGSFVAEHLQCLKGTEHGALRFVHEGENGFDSMDPGSRA